MSFRHFPVLLLKTSSILGPSLPCQPPAWGHPKNPQQNEVTGQQEGPSLRRRGSKWAFLPLSFPQSLFCLCSSSGLNSGRQIRMYVLTAASLTILSTKDLSAFIFSASFIEVTPFLSQMVLTSWFLFFCGICTACRPLSAFLFAVFFCLCALAHSVNGGPGQSHLYKINYNRHIFKIWIFPVDLCKDIPARLEVKSL